jgi:O-antigen/teichoic acid export membrane protein
MATSVIILNKWLIGLFGIDGAALATLIVVLVFSTIKILYIQQKMQMQPFTQKTVLVLVLIAVLFFSFYFWNFSFHPILNIILKTVLLTLIYVLFVIKLNISEDITLLIRKYIK